LLVGASVVLLRHRAKKATHGSTDDVSETRDRRWRGFAAGTIAARPGDVGASGNGWMSEQITPAELRSAVDVWRQSIVDKRAESVLTLDRAFATFPGRYGPELVKLAQTDPEERVRAFSTRVLGKLKNPELGDIFGHLLEDHSPFVRQNAAWALGELAADPEGRAAAEDEIAELQHLSDADPAQAVRGAATEALKKLQ
jgi:HEAT repeat protein